MIAYRNFAKWHSNWSTVQTVRLHIAYEHDIESLRRFARTNLARIIYCESPRLWQKKAVGSKKTRARTRVLLRSSTGT
jgi:hypothetical protein